MKRLRQVVLILSLLVLATVLAATPVFAAVSVIQAPDDGPYLLRIDAYQHCLEDNDVLIVARYQADYDSVPSETIAQAYLGRLMGGATEYGRVTPYAYYNKGYGYGGFSMYWSAAEAPTWEGTYSVELTGSPTLSWVGSTATSAVDGAVADDGGAQTDETTEANNATTDDVTLLPATPAVDDAYYIGSDAAFTIATINLSTPGAGTWTITWEYYDGDGWTTISGVSDATSGFKSSVGNHDVSFSAPSDWAETTIQSIEAYWVRARVSSYTSVTTQPLGAQIWVNSGITAPVASTTSINWRTTGGSTATAALMYTHLIAYAETLSDYWSVALTSTTASGTVLSSYGETYFTNVIPQLRSMSSNLFSSSVESISYEDVVWTNEQAEAATGAWPLDWGGISEWFGMPTSEEVFRTVIGFVIIFFLCGLIAQKTGRTDFAALAGYGLLVVFAVPGWFSPVIVAGFTFLSVLIVGLVFILGKTS